MTLEEQFYNACANGNVDDVKQLLLNNKQININWQDSWKTTPFYIACYNGRIEVVKVLLDDERVDINKVDKHNQTPFYIACGLGHIEVVKLLLTVKRIDVNKANNDSETPFSAACNKEHIEIVKLLLNDQRVDINKANKEGQSPLYLTCDKEQIEIINLLLNNERVDVNKAINNGSTPFYIVCQKGHIEIVKMLLNDQRVDINKADKHNQTPFFVACEKGHIEIIKLLLNDKRIDVNKQAQFTVSFFEIKDGGTPFFVTCYKGHIEIVKLLLKDERIDVNKENKNKTSPFFIACDYGHVEIVKLLLIDERIDTIKSNVNHWTPLYISCYGGKVQIVKYLLASGRKLNLNIKNYDRKTAIDIARENEKGGKSILESDEMFQQRKRNGATIVRLLESFQKNPREVRFKQLLNANNLLTIRKKQLEIYTLFRTSIEFGKNENISILKRAAIFIGIEPSYFLPLNAKSQNEITHLFFRNLNLDSVPISFENFENLIHLDLSKNSFTQIPKTIEILTQLEVLNLSNNQIQEIPSSLSKLLKLQSLDLSNNKIDDKSLINISDLIQLNVLNLSKNQIQEIPSSFSKLAQLQNLDLSNNKINEKNINAISDLIQLKDLDLSNNQIQEISFSFSQLIQLQNLNLSDNKINDSIIQPISDLIQKSREIQLIDLRDNEISEKGENIIEKSLKFNSSLNDLLLDGNNISGSIIKGINEMLKQKRNTLDFNTVSIYLLGYGHVGKTTLRQSIKNMDTWSAWLGLNQQAETIKNNNQTEGVEIDRRVNIGKTNIQIIDFGGQKEYHHGTHLFTRISRSIFLILANPFDFGFEEQVWYWLRLLNLKSSKNQYQNQKAEVMIIFSHKDKENDKNAIEVIETKLDKLINELRTEFEETITINTLWMWMDCTKTKTNEMKELLNELEKIVNKVMDEFTVNIPDISIPQKIINNLNQIFYERNDLGIEIGKILKSDEIIASNWINILLQSHDFLSIKINHGNEKGKEYICVDLEKFGKNILSKIIKPNASKYIYSSNDIIDEILSKENGKWKSIFCEILESLELCFQKETKEYLFPSMFPIRSIGDAQKKWKEEEAEKENGRGDKKPKLDRMKYLGRRIRIEDKRFMFHPSFLPQLICRILSGIVVDKEPLIWNEGLILKHSKEYFIGLFMHGMMESNLQENELNQTNQAVLNSRKHGEPNRLKMMDILIKGPNIKECQILMNTCLESIGYINIHFYGNLKWNIEVLFPSTIQKYYSIIDKRNLFSIPLNESIGNDQIQNIIKEEILQDKLLTLYNSESKNESINKYITHIAFHEGYLEIAKKIIGGQNIKKKNQKRDYNINEMKNEIMFGIYLSCQNGHSNIIEYVIGSGIQIDFRKTFWNKNCLEIASEEQNTEIVNIICEFQRDPLKIKTEYRKKYGFPSQKEIEIAVVIGEKNEKMKVVPPFSLYELSLSIKSTFTILDDIHMQIYDPKFKLFFDLKNINEVKMDSILKIIISSFWGMQVDDRWDRQGKGIKLDKFCIFESNKIIDELLYNKFYDILKKFGFNQETQKLKEVFAINNMDLKKGFEAHRNILFSKELESPKDFKSQSWKTKSDFELRSFFLDNLNDYINEFNWNDGNKPAVIPIIHGTCEKYIWQICQHGLTTLAKLDSGYYGQGVYFTRDFSYSYSYAKMTALSNKSREYFVICCVIPGNVYPVTENPESSNSLKGKPRIPGYQSHCTIVDKRNLAKAFPITTKNYIPEYHADELVVFQDAQILPIFAFSLV